MIYYIEYDSDTIKELASLPRQIQQRVVKKINWLTENVELIKHQSLTANWVEFYKLRVGDYRIIYTFDVEEKLIFIVKIGHRKNIYN